MTTTALPSALYLATLTATTTLSPSFSPSTGGSGSANTGPFLIIAAVIAVCGVLLTALLQWLIGRRTIRVSTETSEGVARRADAEALSKRYHEAATLLVS